MKKYIYGAILALFLALVGYCQYEHHQAVKYQELYSVAAANNKAYESDLAANSEQAKMYQLTVDQLHSSNDSLIQELLQVQKERKIKDSKIEALAYQLSKATRRDTLRLKDTIFVDSVNIDTLISDKWYSLDLSLQYPSTIAVSPTFKSERYVIINAKRETINKPSKIFFIRWFQKKHTVIYVDVEEKNPYITIDKQKFIKIVK